MYQCKFIQQIACLKWFGLIFCYIFKLNHTPSYEKKNDRRCSRVPMNTGSHLCLFFFSSALAANSDQHSFFPQLCHHFSVILNSKLGRVGRDVQFKLLRHKGEEVRPTVKG